MTITRIEKKIEREVWEELLEKRKYQIVIDEHAYYRMSEMQRNIFKEGELMRILRQERPTLIGIQGNGRYALFFKRKEGYLRIICSVKEQYVTIATFVITKHQPVINNE